MAFTGINPAPDTVPAISRTLSASEAAEIQLYNGAGVVRKLLKPGEALPLNSKNSTFYRSCWVFDEDAPSGMRWTFKNPARRDLRGYVNKIVAEFESNPTGEEL
jgi:hypothetical protein